MQHALTDSAPISVSESAALHSVPAVSIMSSTMIQCLPLISPTMFMDSTSPAARRCFIVMASEMFDTFMPDRASMNIWGHHLGA